MRYVLRGYRERTLVDVDRGDGSQGSGRLTRLRWRLRGAWLWPTFVGTTVLESALLHVLPVQGESTGWVAALLVAGCVNLIGVALLGAVGGLWLRRRRPDLPRVVAENYAGTAVLALVAACFVVAGVLHRPAIRERRAAFAEQSLAVRRWVAVHGDPYARSHVQLADTVLVDEQLFRTCVPGRDPKRWLCLVVDTTRSPPAVKRDLSREPNALMHPRGGFR
jgi:hypothetical protein